MRCSSSNSSRAIQRAERHLQVQVSTVCAMPELSPGRVPCSPFHTLAFCSLKSPSPTSVPSLGVQRECIVLRFLRRSMVIRRGYRRRRWVGGAVSQRSGIWKRWCGKRGFARTCIGTTARVLYCAGQFRGVVVEGLPRGYCECEPVLQWLL